MGKWVTNTIAALAFLALTSLLGALLKGPIDGLANPNRLSAEVQLAPWVPKPALLDEEDDEEPGEEEETEPVVITGRTSDEIIEQLEFKKSTLVDFGVAVMNIENGSSNTVTDINIRLDSPFSAPQVAFIDSADNVHILGEVERVALPDMKPGDRTVVYFWGNFNSYNIENYFRTYSSEGAFRLSFEWPEVTAFEFQSAIGNFLDEYAWTVFVVTSVILTIILFIAVAVYSEYLKGIFVSKDLREEEVERFMADPKGFQMNYSSAQTAWNVYQARMKTEAKSQGAEPATGSGTSEAGSAGRSAGSSA